MTPRKILLAEDDMDDQQFFFDFLRHRTDVLLLPAAENGEALFEYLESADNQAMPDVIILDQNMPRRNGLQTLTMLKENTRYKHIPVMIYSTYADEALVQRSNAIGAAMVAAKPSDKEGYNRMMDIFMSRI